MTEEDSALESFAQPPQPSQLLASYDVMVGTPSMNDAPVGIYRSSLEETYKMVKHFGGVMHLAQLPGCSDLAFARALIFGNFLRSACTHLLWIDDDMGWDANDVIRMLLAGKDFIGGVGRKKIEEPEYAVSHEDENGERATLQAWVENNIAIAEVTYVGMAFMMLKKAAALRMFDFFPELRFPNQENTECALFDPIILHRPNGTRRRLAEDFAFCHRVAQTGMRVNVIPDINLKHRGIKDYEGRWCDIFRDVKTVEKEAT